MHIFLMKDVGVQVNQCVFNQYVSSFEWIIPQSTMPSNVFNQWHLPIKIIIFYCSVYVSIWILWIWCWNKKNEMNSEKNLLSFQPITSSSTYGIIRFFEWRMKSLQQFWIKFICPWNGRPGKMYWMILSRSTISL